MSKKSSMALAAAFVLSIAPSLTPQIAVASTPTQKQVLHRVDFRVEGASCVVCLRRIAKTFRDSKGILKADVSVFRPYWAIVIYDANQADFKEISDSIAKKERVKLAELEDKEISSVPAILIPKGLSAPPSGGHAPELKEP